MCSVFVGGQRGSDDARQIVRPRCLHPTFRKGDIRGGHRLPRIDSPLDDSGRTGLRHPRGHERRHCKGQRWYFSIGLMLPLLAGSILAGCRSSAKPDPATIWQNVRSDSIRGNLDVAKQEAEQARKDFSASNPEWALKFRLLEAEILTYQGRWPEVIALLDSPGIPYPEAGDIAIKRNLLCGRANAKLGHAQQADSELLEAQRLSDKSNSSLSGEVLRARAVVQIDRDHLTEGADLSRQSLKVAHQQRDTFLEASDLVNLGYVALSLEHYDEAVALLDEGADSARSIQARPLTQVAL